jgi:hypothetical protein
MATKDVQGKGTPEQPWKLRTPSGQSEFTAWGRAATNPVKGFYGLKKGGRFANDVPPVLEVLGLAEVEHSPKSNRMRTVVRG